MIRFFCASFCQLKALSCVTATRLLVQRKEGSAPRLLWDASGAVARQHLHWLCGAGRCSNSSSQILMIRQLRQLRRKPKRAQQGKPSMTGGGEAAGHGKRHGKATAWNSARNQKGSNNQQWAADWQGSWQWQPQNGDGRDAQSQWGDWWTKGQDPTTSTSTERRQGASTADPEAPSSDRDGAENVASMEDVELASGSGVSGKAPHTGKEFVPEYSGESPMRDYQSASSRRARA